MSMCIHAVLPGPSFLATNTKAFLLLADVTSTEISCTGPNIHSCLLTLYLIETLFNAFANRADPDQGLLCLLMEKYDISDLTLVDPIRNFFVLCT